MLFRNIIIFLAAGIFPLALCAQAPDNKGPLAQTRSHGVSLKEAFSGYFPVGVSVAPSNLVGKEAELIISQFNSLTPENAMKFGPLHPEQNRYNWAGADSIVAFAQKHGMKVRGHTLVWHQQNPGWVFKDAKGDTVGKEVLLARLKEHIQTVMKRYKGKVYAWDVVNEALDDDSTKYLRDSPWFRICGEDFIVKAYQFAHEADPDALLFYNDYRTEHPERRERIFRLLKRLKDAKIPLHGVGLQAHWNLKDPGRQELVNTIDQFRSLGLQVQVTELDISVLPEKKQRDSVWLAAPDVYTGAIEQQHIAQYEQVFRVFKTYKDHLTGVTFWNLSDKDTWLDQTPSAKGKRNFPLLFDAELKPKEVFYRVISVVKE